MQEVVSLPQPCFVLFTCLLTFCLSCSSSLSVHYTGNFLCFIEVTPLIFHELSNQDKAVFWQELPVCQPEKVGCSFNFCATLLINIQFEHCRGSIKNPSMQHQQTLDLPVSAGLLVISMRTHISLTTSLSFYLLYDVNFRTILVYFPVLSLSFFLCLTQTTSFLSFLQSLTLYSLFKST